VGRGRGWGVFASGWGWGCAAGVVAQKYRLFFLFAHLGDLATNVAEDVIYTAEGEIVRHRTQAYS
jgi:hypothetical protein